MSKPELVLSSATSFFCGRLEAVFKNARRYGFKYVEIIPYRWTNPEKTLALQKKYNVEIAGIHLPTSWKKSCWEMLRKSRGVLEKLSSLGIHFYTGEASKSPGWQIASLLRQKQPYVIFHTDVAADMGSKFAGDCHELHAVIENIPHREGNSEFYWDPAETQKTMLLNGLEIGLVFDPGHFGESIKKLPALNPVDAYKNFCPEIIHISYNSRGQHLLPDKKEQEELKQMLKIHVPKYIVIETFPFVSIKKAKSLLDHLIEESQTTQLKA